MGYAKPTFSHDMRVCREPVDDGYADFMGAARGQTDAGPQEESECSLTLDSSSVVDIKRKSHSAVCYVLYILYILYIFVWLVFLLR